MQMASIMILGPIYDMREEINSDLKENIQGKMLNKIGFVLCNKYLLHVGFMQLLTCKEKGTTRPQRCVNSYVVKPNSRM